MKRTKYDFLFILLLLVGLASGCPEKKPEESVYFSNTGICGNNRHQSGERCDGTDLNNKSCEDFGLGAGRLGCKADCHNFDFENCAAPATCGNGSIDEYEKCDGLLLDNKSCEDFGRGSGTLRCLDNCADFDLSGCGAPPNCGDNDINGSAEVCDGEDFGRVSCEALGFSGGDLRCSTDCLNIDTSTCADNCEPDCGNRQCGPDPVCNTSCGSCAEGVCNASGQCDTSLSCPDAADCGNRQCGPDPVCNTSCGSCAEGVCNASGQCDTSQECGTGLVPQGQLNSGLASITFDNVSVEMEHARDIDAYEDGCISSVDLNFSLGTGCILNVSTSASMFNENGCFFVEDLGLSADSQCPGFSNADEGNYYAQRPQEAEICLNPNNVPGSNIASACFAEEITVNIPAMIFDMFSSGTELSVSASTLRISGQVESTGSTSQRCPESFVRPICESANTRRCDGNYLVSCNGYDDEDGRRLNCLNYGNLCVEISSTMAGCLSTYGQDCAHEDDGRTYITPCGDASGLRSDLACDVVTRKCITVTSSDCSPSSFEEHCYNDDYAMSCFDAMGDGIGQLVVMDCSETGEGGYCDASGPSCEQRTEADPDCPPNAHLEDNQCACDYGYHVNAAHDGCDVGVCPPNSHEHGDDLGYRCDCDDGYHINAAQDGCEAD